MYISIYTYIYIYTYQYIRMQILQIFSGLKKCECCFPSKGNGPVDIAKSWLGKPRVQWFLEAFLQGFLLGVPWGV